MHSIYEAISALGLFESDEGWYFRFPLKPRGTTRGFIEECDVQKVNEGIKFDIILALHGPIHGIIEAFQAIATNYFRGREIANTR